MSSIQWGNQKVRLIATAATTPIKCVAPPSQAQEEQVGGAFAVVGWDRTEKRCLEYSLPEADPTKGTIYPDGFCFS